MLCDQQPPFLRDKFNISSKKLVYSFHNHSIPIAAVFTKHYKMFRDIIIEHLTDIKMQIDSLTRKINTEKNILATQPTDIPDRNKTIIRNYITKLERDIEQLIPIRNDLQVLKCNETLMKKVFKKIHGISKN